MDWRERFSQPEGLMSEERPSVLVVEDEPDLADLYAEWLKTEYDVRTAYGGRAALDGLGDEVDIVLLDRRMPDLSGDEVLDAIRERGIDCRVAMVTAVEPDFDIVAMGFDDYLVKPVSREELQETVSNLVVRNEYDEGMQELFSLASKKALLESEKGSATLDEQEEYEDLTERLAELRADLDQKLGELDGTDDMVSLYKELGRGIDVDGAGDEQNGTN
jgi:DNA-binding response OmpR family regulator